MLQLPRENHPAGSSAIAFPAGVAACLSSSYSYQWKNTWYLLATEKGDKLYRRRKCDVEPVFDHIKHNREFDRFTLRGLFTTTLEWGLLSIAHNFLKWETHV
ncbi:MULTISPECIES: transposase [Bacillaceae]|uniref:Transposase n=1 Tax=Evansella alkalicola TaxID=745819 RepID=A0ABS6JPG7_9BACI|nr:MULTISPECIES: transposase [Bacillaceae]MBU9720461.1 transposase [Bacillus alkalicola]